MTARQKSALEALVAAAIELNEAWSEDDQGDLSGGYPECLPSFDEFTGQLMTWRDTSIAGKGEY